MRSRFQYHVNCGETAAHLLLHVIKRIGTINGKADEDDVRVGVAEWAQAVVIFLSSSIPKSEFNALPIDFDVRDVVLKNSRDINLSIKSRSGHVPNWNVGECSVLQQVAVNDVSRSSDGEVRGLRR
jgi:hypothetical protein